MTFKQFKKWCYERACDGCWSIRVAIFCFDVCNTVSKCHFWQREKAWQFLNVLHGIEEGIVRPINEKIQADYGKEKT